jgi:PKD repeat protein
MKVVPMTRWPHSGLLGLLVVLSAVCIVPGCRKKEENTPTSAAAARSRFAPRSRLLVEDVPLHVTPAPTPERIERIEGEDEDLPPISVSADANPTSGGVPLAVTFSAEVSDAPAGVRYRWDFGDHSEPSKKLKVQHTYTKAGEYTATFSATGYDVNESQDVTIEVTDEGFDLDVDNDPDIGTAPLSVHFSAMLDDDLPQPVSFRWEFGDGTLDFSNPTQHTYTKAGEYTARVLVTDGRGRVARREVEIQVDPHEEQDEAEDE